VTAPIRTVFEWFRHLITPPRAVVCSWCGRHLSGPVDAPLVSHGCCKACAERVMAQWKGAPR
jgi:hypothetical protein